MITQGYARASLNDLQAIDSLVKMGNDLSPNGMVETRKDWEMVQNLWKFWKIQQPSHYQFFKEEIQRYRDAYKTNKLGSAEEKGGASIQHTGEMPETFYRILKSFFPKQQLNKEFFKGLIEYIPEFQMHESKTY